VAGFDGGAITSNAGALLLGATDRAITLVSRFAACLRDARMPGPIEHDITTLVGQRIFGIALAHEEVVDHDQVRHDPVLAVRAGKLAARRRDGAPLAGRSTLNRLEHAPAGEPGRHPRIGHDAGAIEGLFVAVFLEAHRTAPPQRIILDLDATDLALCGHRKAASSTATATLIAACRSTSSAAATCWQPGCGGRTSTPRPARCRRSRASFAGSAPAGRAFASCSAPIAASPARR
jgi:hypothetical protein